MEKYLMPVALVILILSTVMITIIGEANADDMARDGACIESRSCAIRYIDRLEEK
ncbi:hypothetical protein [Sinanaerobacter chloroacetimidivorans]|uniref:Uncharacterized protein n=1 Tax=Sinanaerobacter chloroacetimidivorans TaxID=2818044 RepID=A0A8J7VZ73_9FIRM|nr:hypothetical protein [Sinanaerobacter chloroacetimidivorans]MBR0596340.1 hypothetical protein [Sinanaerobacter chloroacetimidivorans]